MAPPPSLALRTSYIEKMAQLEKIRIRKQQLVNLLGQQQPQQPPQPPQPQQ